MARPINDGNSALDAFAWAPADVGVFETAPPAGWDAMGESDHFVQFYETDEFILDSLGGFVGAGLGAGDACLVVATEAHRGGLDERLRARGLDVDHARARGQYVALDAAETLSRFMAGGSPDPDRFVETVGGIVARAAEGGRRVRIYGEMVALLWAEGNRDGALRLEELWNRLQQARPFTLFCAYPMDGFGGDALAEPMRGVCAGHSRVIPAESYTALASPEERLRVITALQQKANSLQAVKDELERLLVSEQVARAEAERANQMKDEFLATVSHELRTPLSAIIGWSHMLRTASLDEATAARALEAIERNAQAQAQLVEDILDVSRVISGQLRLNVGPVDAAAVINAAIDSVQLAADSKGIRLGVTLDPSARHITGDAGRLQQAVWNLVSNAIKFTPAGGRVEVRLGRSGSDLEISVSDTGCGIGPDFLPHVFDRFRQADGSTTRRHGGLGLGLSIARQLVELHGGSVHADSPGEGGGSTFTIRLPFAETIEPAQRAGRRAAGPRPSVGADARAGARISLEGIRVLLVDDDRDTLQMLCVMLAECGAEVQAASCAADALELLQWYEPDVLVSDLAMPVEDGYSLISRVREFEAGGPRRVPAVALTALVRVEDRKRALSAGFNMFVPKPVEPSELLSAIESLAGPCAA